MFRVCDFMTKDPITVDAQEKISAVLDLMKFHKIHRIPVVNASDELIGLITEGMIMADNSATSLSIYELNYLLSKTDVRTVMLKHPISIEENALMEEATEKLLRHDIGCLPVVDARGKVTGILTQNDIFKAFLQMLDWGTQGTRLVVQVKDEIGALEDLGHQFAKQDISIRSLNVYSLENGEAKILIKTQEIVPDSFDDVLKQAGYGVLERENF